MINARAGSAWILLLGPLVAALLAAQPERTAGGAGGSAVVLTATLDDQAITPGTFKYLQRALRRAGRQRAECLIIELDTPGGLLSSTRLLTKRMLASRTPVVVYVAPSGSRAASAGVFITLASHVAAMAPGTTIGAAHPVRVGGLPIGPQPGPGPEEAEPGPDAEKSEPALSGSSAMDEKIVNDTVAWARALAQQRGRNADWAAEAVERSVSVTAAEALEKGVIELVARDPDELLEKLDGRRVTTPAGEVVLNTADARLERVSIWWGEQVLAIIAHPNIAFLLMIFGFYGILFELYSPGWGVSGTLGVICIVLALFGLAVLPVNYLGLALIAIAIALMVAEVFVTSYGALGAAGAICLVFGGVMLVDSPRGFAQVSLSVVLPVAVATLAITLLLVSGIVRSHRAPVRTGGEGLVGGTGRAVSDFKWQKEAFEGTIAVHGERWRAVSPQPLKVDDPCEIRSRDGLTLHVVPKPDDT